MSNILEYPLNRWLAGPHSNCGRLGGGGLLPVAKIDQMFPDYILLYVLNRNKPCMKFYSTRIFYPIKHCNYLSTKKSYAVRCLEAETV